MRILIIEDDRDLGLLLQKGMEREGYEVTLCFDGEEGLYYLSSNIYDLAVVDRMLPKMDGAALLLEARRRGVTTPVIMATALGQIGDRVGGLDAGADDYLVKPFDIRELQARIRALTRRPRVFRDEGPLRYRDVSLFPGGLRIEGPLGECAVSKREADLLAVFMNHAEKTLPREYLYQHVWGADGMVEEASLDIYIHYVRRHLEAVSGGVRITTLRRVGYRMEAGE